MEIICTRPTCPRPLNQFPDLDDSQTLSTVQQKFCTTCGMPLILSGRYLPVKRLGQGGFGKAYLAKDRYTPGKRPCVVKQFQPAGDLSPQQMQLALQLFEREAEVLERIGNNHPQIPDLFAFFPLEVGGQPPARFFYLVQEFIDGKNLEQELEEKGQFSETEVLEVLTEVLKILSFVHANNSIHRDIKPANIMRERSGKLVLLDFGAVKQVTQGANPERSTGIYSLGFAPPEQMAGGEVYHSTDFYALAVTCICLLTGKPASDLFDSYRNQWNWQPYAKVSPALANILDKMLQASPSERFQSAEEILTALTNLGQKTSISGNSGPVNIAQSPVTPPTTLSNKRFSELEILSSAAFTGFQGGLLFIILEKLLPSPGVGVAVGVAILSLIIFIQNRRFIEGKDLAIIAILSALIFWFSPFRAGLTLEMLIIITGGAGLVALAVTTLFRLVYTIISRIL